MSPVQLQLLLHIAVTPVHYSNTFCAEDFANATCDELEKREMIYKDIYQDVPIGFRYHNWKLTQKGTRFFEALQNLPEPVLQYVMPSLHEV